MSDLLNCSPRSSKLHIVSLLKRPFIALVVEPQMVEGQWVAETPGEGRVREEVVIDVRSFKVVIEALNSDEKEKT